MADRKERVVDYGKLEEYRQAYRDLKYAENYFNVCESRFIPHAILNLCYAENRVNEILKELRHDDLDKTVSSDHES